LASKKLWFKNIVSKFANKFVFESKFIVFTVLEVWVDKTISDGHTHEVQGEESNVLENEVVHDRGDVMPGI